MVKTVKKKDMPFDKAKGAGENKDADNMSPPSVSKAGKKPAPKKGK